MKNIFLVLVTLGFLSACSDSGNGGGGIPGSGLPELSQEQKEKTLRVNNSLQDASVVTESANLETKTATNTMGGVPTQEKAEVLSKAQMELWTMRLHSLCVPYLSWVKQICSPPFKGLSKLNQRSVELIVL